MAVNRYKAHEDLKNKIKVSVCKNFTNVRLFDRHVGMFYRKNGSPIKINKKGMADLWGVMSINGVAVHFEIEIKTGKAVQTKEQKVWENFCSNFSIKYAVCRSVEDSLNFLEKLGNDAGKNIKIHS